MASSTPLVKVFGQASVSGSAVNETATITLPYPATAAGQHQYLFVSARAVVSGELPEVNTPGGWTLVSSTAVKGHPYVPMYIFRRTASSFDPGNSYSFSCYGYKTVSVAGQPQQRITSAEYSAVQFALSGVAAAPVGILNNAYGWQATSTVTSYPIPKATSPTTGNYVTINFVSLWNGPRLTGQTLDVTLRPGPGMVAWGRSLLMQTASNSFQSAFFMIAKALGQRSVTWDSKPKLGIVGGQLVLTPTEFGTNNAGGDVDADATMSGRGFNPLKRRGRGKSFTVTAKISGRGKGSFRYFPPLSGPPLVKVINAVGYSAGLVRDYTTVQLPFPATAVGQEQMVIVTAVTRTNNNPSAGMEFYYNGFVSKIAGWIAVHHDAVVLGRSGYVAVYRRTAEADDLGATFGVQFGANGTAGADASSAMTCIVFALDDAGPAKASRFDKVLTAANGPITIPDAAGATSSDIVINYAFAVSKAVTGSPTGRNIRAGTDALFTFENTYGSYLPGSQAASAALSAMYLQAAVGLYPGPKSRTMTTDGTMSVLPGQLVLPGIRTGKQHRGGAAAGVWRLSGTGVPYTSIRKYRPGTPFQATVQLIGRGTRILKRTGILTGIGLLRARRGIFRRKPPHFDLSSTVAGEDTQIILTIPEKTRPTDLLLLGVAWDGTDPVQIPTGWKVLETATVEGHTQYAAFWRSAARTDPGSTVTVVVSLQQMVQVAGVLAVYTPSIIDTQSSTTLTASSSRVVFGPTAENPGTLRVTVAAARANSFAGEQITFVKPLTLVENAIAATPRAQAESDIGRSLAAVVADYTGTTSLRGQITAVVPVILRAVTVDLAGIPFYQGHFYARPRMWAARGVKGGTPAPHRNNVIASHFWGGPGGRGWGAHSMRPRQIRYSGYLTIHPAVGWHYDSYRAGWLRLSPFEMRFYGYGNHNNGYGGTLNAAPKIRVPRGAQLASGAGGRIDVRASISGSGRETWDRPRSLRRHRIDFNSVLHGLTGSTYVNYIEGEWGGDQPNTHNGHHSDIGAWTLWSAKYVGNKLVPFIDDIIPTYRVWRGLYQGRVERGKVQFYIEERYTQIRGVASFTGRGQVGPPIRLGHLEGLAVLYGSNRIIPDVEDFEMEIIFGIPTVIAWRPAEPEEISRQITLGYPTVTQALYSSVAAYSDPPSFVPDLTEPVPAG